MKWNPDEGIEDEQSMQESNGVDNFTELGSI